MSAAVAKFQGWEIHDTNGAWTLVAKWKCVAPDASARARRAALDWYMNAVRAIPSQVHLTVEREEAKDGATSSE